MNLLNMASLTQILYPAAGLDGLVNVLINSWIGPAFVGILAIVAAVLLWKKQLAAFFSFAFVALIAGIFIFAGGDLFGNQNKGLVKTGTDLAKKVNTIDANPDHIGEYFTVNGK